MAIKIMVVKQNLSDGATLDAEVAMTRQMKTRLNNKLRSTGSEVRWVEVENLRKLQDCSVPDVPASPEEVTVGKLRRILAGFDDGHVVKILTSEGYAEIDSIIPGFDNHRNVIAVCPKERS